MELKKARTDLLVMLVLMIVSLLLRFVIIPTQIQTRVSWNEETAFTSRTFPIILTWVLFFFSLFGFIGAVKRLFDLRQDGYAKKEAAGAGVGVAAFIRPLLLFVIAAVYGWMFTKAGYIISAVFVCPAVLAVLGCRKWQYYLCVYGFAAAVYLVFKVALMVPLP